MRILLVILFLFLLSAPAFPDEQSDIDAVERAWLIEQEAIKVYNRTIKRAANAIAKSSLQKMVNAAEQEYATAWNASEEARKKYEQAQSRVLAALFPTSSYTEEEERLAKKHLEILKKESDKLWKEYNELGDLFSQKRFVLEELTKRRQKIYIKMIRQFLGEEISKIRQENKDRLLRKIKQLMKKKGLII